MTLPAPFTADEITTLLIAPGVFPCTEDGGFAIGRVAADEAELLTIAVAPEARRKGLGRRLLAAFEAEAARRGAAVAFLEVAETNAAARALYTGAGWRETGRRRGYYRVDEATRLDAIVMTRELESAR